VQLAKFVLNLGGQSQQGPKGNARVSDMPEICSSRSGAAGKHAFYSAAEYVARAQFAARKWQDGKTHMETAAGAAADAAAKAPRAWLHPEQTLGLIWAEFDEATTGAAVSHILYSVLFYRLYTYYCVCGLHSVVRDSHVTCVHTGK
jgi:hypothetical protein